MEHNNYFNPFFKKKNNNDKVYIFTLSMLQLWAKHGGLFVVLMCLNGFNMFILYSEVPKNNHWSPSASQAFF